MSNKLNIQPIYLRQHFFKGIIYGEPGVGKTPLIGTAPKALILDADEGTESALIWGSKAKFQEVSSHEDLVNVHEYLREEDHDFEWCILDSGTLFLESGMADIMEDVVARKKERNKWVPDQREYLINMNRFNEWVVYMKRLPINFLMTAHVMTVEHEMEDGTTITTYMPDLKGKKGQFTQNLCGHMNFVGHLTRKKKDGKYIQILRAERHGSYYGKNRWGTFAVMQKPSIPKIMASIEPVIAANTRKKTTKKKSTSKKKKARR